MNELSKETKSNKNLFLSALMSNFQVKKLDFSAQETIKKIEECKKKQQECLDRKYVDWEKLSHIYITI